MRNGKIKWMVRTAFFIALVILVQLLSNMLPIAQLMLGPVKLSQLVTGSLVNLVLIVAAALLGIGSGVTVGILSALLASLFGIQLPLPQMLPLVAIGNATIVAVAWAFFHMGKKIGGKTRLFVESGGILLAAAAKCAVLWAGVHFIIVPLVQPAGKLAAVLTLNFSWPQLITGIIGGAVALALLPVLRKATEN